MSSNSPQRRPVVEMVKKDNESRFDIWSSIQKDEEEKKRCCLATPWPPHPLLRRSSSLMSQQSLELCTESLGSETGADGFSSADELDPFFSPSSKALNFEEKEGFSSSKTDSFEDEDKEEEAAGIRVNHHSSHGWATPPPRPLPPSLSSSGIQMRSTRREGRLIVEAILAPSHNYLHAERHGGRLLLSFVNPNFQSNIISLFHEQKSTGKNVDDDDDDDDDYDEYNGDVEGKEEDKFVAAVNEFLHPNSTTEMIPTAITAAAAADIFRTSTSNRFDCNLLDLKYLGKWRSQETSTVEAEANVLTQRAGLFDTLTKLELLFDMRRCCEPRAHIKDFHNREDFMRCHLRTSWTEIIK